MSEGIERLLLLIALIGRVKHIYFDNDKKGSPIISSTIIFIQDHLHLALVSHAT